MPSENKIAAERISIEHCGLWEKIGRAKMRLSQVDDKLLDAQVRAMEQYASVLRTRHADLLIAEGAK
ncbi:MAG: hypothetical protein LBH13_06490 [Cellulomonadaceae bacterium]|jgi:hypothetical protein|nr:hypothetical protein [Cellulomonadaceae bacterium]